ncbi:hypothetical protein L596_006521 [Steinernema carpocapsae]|uniref:Uncharacterized protein n=1 Tax=Steinernema carpocapsae TaxID=34508 RepID=A0A4U8V4S6_STECR|nr:hypothetical protein L596_006521 [Steinernema carpocapsae]
MNPRNHPSLPLRHAPPLLFSGRLRPSCPPGVNELTPEREAQPAAVQAPRPAPCVREIPAREPLGHILLVGNPEMPQEEQVDHSSDEEEELQQNHQPSLMEAILVAVAGRNQPPIEDDWFVGMEVESPWPAAVGQQIENDDEFDSAVQVSLPSPSAASVQPQADQSRIIAQPRSPAPSAASVQPELGGQHDSPQAADHLGIVAQPSPPAPFPTSLQPQAAEQSENPRKRRFSEEDMWHFDFQRPSQEAYTYKVTPFERVSGHYEDCEPCEKSPLEEKSPEEGSSKP